MDMGYINDLVDRITPHRVNNGGSGGGGYSRVNYYDQGGSIVKFNGVFISGALFFDLFLFGRTKRNEHY